MKGGMSWISGRHSGSIPCTDGLAPVLYRLRRHASRMRPYVNIDWSLVRGEPRRLIVPIVGVILAAAVCLVVAALVRNNLRSPMWLVPGWLGLSHFEHAAAARSDVAVGAGLAVCVGSVWSRLAWYREPHTAVVVALASSTAGSLGNGLQLLINGSATDYLLIHRVGIFNASDILLLIGIALLAYRFIPPTQFDLRYRDVVLGYGAFGAVVVTLGALHIGSSYLPGVFAIAAAVSVWSLAHLRWLMGGGREFRRQLRSYTVERLDESPEQVVGDIHLALTKVRGRDVKATRYVLATLCIIYRRLKQPVELRRSADEFLELCQQVSSAECRAWALDYLGYAEIFEGHDHRALSLWRQALELTQSPADDDHRLGLLRVIAVAEALQGRKVASRMTFETAIELACRMGQYQRARALSNEMSESLTVEVRQSLGGRYGVTGTTTAAGVKSRGRSKGVRRGKGPRT